MSIVKKVYAKIRCYYFKKKFKSIGKNSGFGDWGYGDTCQLVGLDKVEIGNGSWFGKQTELIVDVAGVVDKKSSHERLGLIVGNNFSSTSRCRITCAHKITIGNHVLLAPEVFITDHNHGMTPSSIDDYASQPLLVGSVVIEDNVWIGQRACILPGVTIGKFSIIGANSVVTKDIPPYSLAVGAPARVIKEWDKDRREWVPIEGEEGRRSQNKEYKPDYT